MVKESELATEAEVEEVMAQAKAEAADRARKAGLILPPSAGSAGSVAKEDTGIHNLIELYDSEIVAIHERVLPGLTEHEGKSFLADDWTRRRDAFEREVAGRFEEIGLVARVVGWYIDAEDPNDNAPSPRIEIQGRTERVEFDYDKMVAEVTRDTLGVGEEGAIG